jgi:uncharacterized RDD family membrane protein YckC
MSDRVEAEAVQPAYGRFSRRLKAVVIDWMIMIAVLVAALFAAVLINSDHIGRIIGFTVVAVLLLYEPILVSLTGSTIGHYRTNLRVVDNRTHGNISFMKAIVRIIIKDLLGLYSFVTMATTSRHQAVHDLLTQSTVQIRDRSKARFQDYVTVRSELLSPAMPSVWRRILVIIAYVAAAYVLAGGIAVGLSRAGLLTARCVARVELCSTSEYSLLLGTGLGIIVIAILCIVQGWRGRLFGCRMRRTGLQPNNN